MKLLPLIGFVNLGILLNSLFCPVTKAQIKTDNSLPNNSIVTPEGQVIQIEGGTRRGDNLFHSFEEFSVPADHTASFKNAVDIQNIFSRVTGNLESEIDGVLSTQGTADLFLINPNGIIFGDSAALNIGGSFLATTAESLVFEDGIQFKTTGNQTTPLLTITAPVGLGLGANPGQIINRSQALSFTDGLTVGLQVQPRKTLALLGGEIILDGGFISANEGRIELGAVADENIVSLAPDDRGWKFDYEAINSFQDINLSQSLVSSIGDLGGDIKIQGKNITFTENSQILLITLHSNAGNLTVEGSESVVLNGFGTALLNQVEKTASGEIGILNIKTKQLSIFNGAVVASSTNVTGTGVNIQINASDSVEIEGVDVTKDGSFSSALSTRSMLDDEPESTNGSLDDKAVGAEAVDAANFILETKELTIKNGGKISTSTSDQSNAGNLTVIASDSILLEGRNTETNIPSGIFAQVVGEATGNGGSLSVETSQLTILDGAQISTAANNSGQGGNINIDALDSIVLSGTSATGNETTSSSGIFTSTQPGASGDSGNIELNTGLLTVEKGAALSVNNRGTGKGGNASINVDRLLVRDGGEIGAGSLVGDDAVDDLRGVGGTLTINATDSVEVIGTETIRDETVGSSIFSKSEGTGDSGNLSIFTPNLTVAELGNIDVSATGTGEAGNLNINAQNITLDRGSFIAETRVGDKGNISLNNADTLLLRNNSEITTNAFELATGGDITISSDGVALFDNSDITANAVGGQGGNIQITTQGILQESNSQITANSERGIDGTVIFNTPDVDPTNGIQKLPNLTIDVENILAQDFCKLEDEKIAKGSSFIITGRGGLIPTSRGSISNRDRLVNWVSRDDIEVSNNVTVGVRQREEDSADKSYPDIQQSQGLKVAADGTTWLTANVPNTVSQNSKAVHPDCNASK